MKQNKNVIIKNIYYMLSYAFQSLKQSLYEDIAVEEFEDIHNLFAGILSNGIGSQLKQGLYREYVNLYEDLAVMRGKINIYGTIKNKITQKQLLACEYDELSENNLLNQIIKTTVMILLHHSKVQLKYKDRLKKEMLYFSNVDTVDPFLIKWSAIRFLRNNQSYRILISICQLVIQGLLITTEKGDYKLASFIDDQYMCRLYEKFLFEYYTQTFPSLSVRAAQIPWALDDDIGTLLPVMQTDVTIQKGEKVLIIDAKYYSHSLQMQYDKHTIHSNNLYQIFTYVKNKSYELKESSHIVSGLLLYARTEDEIQPDCNYMMSGNRIIIKTLDLNCDFKVIGNQLNLIVQEYFNIG